MTSSESNPSRILIIRPSALGDVCRSVPVLASLRSAFPHAQIDWVVQEEFSPAIAAHPALNNVVEFPRSQFKMWLLHPPTLLRAIRWLRGLRRKRYDLVLDCQGLSRSAVMCIATGAPEVVGLRTARELAWVSYDIKVPIDRDAPLPSHTVDQMLALVQAIGIKPIPDMRLYCEPRDQAWWSMQRREGIGSGEYVVLAPTSRWLSKRWPMERWGQIVAPLLDRGFQRVIVIGSRSEVEQVQPLFEHARREVKPEFIMDQVGKTSIGQTMAMIEQAGLVIANDSAPLHMAVGFDRPCIGLFGPTDPHVVGPYRRDDAVIRGYQPRPGERINYKDRQLGDSLMRYISTSAVLQKVDAVMASAMEARSAMVNHQA